MKPTNSFYFDKGADPFADTLAAQGLAALLYQLLEQADPRSRAQRSVHIVDCGAYYELRCSQIIDDDLMARACASGYPLMLFQPLQTAKNADSVAEVSVPIQYEAERDQRAGYFEWFNALPKDQRARIIQGEIMDNAPEPPHLHWDTFRAINPAALIGYNALAINWWGTQPALPQVLDILLTTVSSTPNDIAGAERVWKWLDKEMGWGISSDASALQLFNPAQGKGQNRAKANNLSMGNVSGFWLLEWLKVAGFYRAGMTRLLSTDDRKSYVVAPIQMDASHLAKIMEQFARSMVGRESAVRSDVLAALRFTKTFLQYAEANPAYDLMRRPRDLVAGFHTAFYKDLGNAVATMNLSFIALPGWVHVSNPTEVRQMQELLEGHEQIIRQFDESHSDEIALLQAYRDFVSGDDIHAFFKFTTAYAGFIIGRRERNQYVRQFTTEGLERLLMNSTTDFSEIIHNEGFQHVAYAIRQSTVTAQYKRQQGDRRYDVRYGLNHELNRAARRPEDFLATLGEFMGKYNAENAQVMETREGPYRTSLTTEDIEQIVRLVDQYGSVLICNLLIAYGYARVQRDEPVTA